MAPNETRVPLASEADIVTARQKGRALAVELGFQGADLTLIATAISEVSRNIVEYAQRGEILLRPANHGNTRGLSIVARDDGPGIPDVAQALQHGYSSRRWLGLGFPGARLLLDDFDILSHLGAV